MLARHLHQNAGDQGQALVAELIIQNADPDGDRASLERLAVWALRYSPVVAADPPDGLVLDTIGADHLHGGESAMLAEAPDGSLERG